VLLAGDHSVRACVGGVTRAERQKCRNSFYMERSVLSSPSTVGPAALLWPELAASAPPVGGWPLCSTRGREGPHEMISVSARAPTSFGGLPEADEGAARGLGWPDVSPTV